ncbi:hypothetical protein GQ457_03G015020 [Hibiscus cannabinus]
MLKGKALIKEIDMPEKMQTQAIDYAFQALDFYDVSDCISIAAHIKIKKKQNLHEFDKKYGGGWQCVVGSNFGCFFTHTKGTFLYFYLGTLNFLIFKGWNGGEDRGLCRFVIQISYLYHPLLKRLLEKKMEPMKAPAAKSLPIGRDIG